LEALLPGTDVHSPLCSSAFLDHWPFIYLFRPTDGVNVIIYDNTTYIPGGHVLIRSLLL